MESVGLINDAKGLPRKYKFSAFMRYSTLFIGIMLLVYAVFVLFFKTTEETKTFFKIVPFIIIFLAFDSLGRNLFMLNKVYLTKDFVRFSSLMGRSTLMLYPEITKMELYQGRKRLIKIFHMVNGQEKVYYLTLAFPNILEIVNSIVELTPHVQLDEFMQKIIITQPAK